MYSTVWLGEWTDDAGEVTSKLDSQGGNTSSYSSEVLDQLREKALKRIEGYFFIGLGQATAVMVAGICLALGCLAASTKLHSAMLRNILRAPMVFFDSTPIGRIMNRSVRVILNSTVDELTLVFDCAELVRSCFEGSEKTLTLSISNSTCTWTDGWMLRPKSSQPWFWSA